MHVSAGVVVPGLTSDSVYANGLYGFIPEWWMWSSVR